MRYRHKTKRFTDFALEHFATVLRRFVTQAGIISAALLAVPCVAQLPPGVLYSTTLPSTVPAGTVVGTGVGPGGVPTVSAVATDAAGNSYVTGSAYLYGYASTPGVVQPVNAGGTCTFGQTVGLCPDAFIAKFNSSGTLVFLTYLGGTGSDIPNSLAVDATGDIYVGGTTTSTDFPLAGTPWRPALTNEGTFIAKLSSDGTKLIWSTVLNGSLIQSAIGPDGSVYYVALATGPYASQGATLTKLTPDGQFVATVNVSVNTQAVAVGGDGSVYIGGTGFAAKMGPNLSGFAWQTSLGATTTLNLLQPAPDGSLWIAGTTSGLAFPVSPNALQPQPSAGGSGYLVHLSADGSTALAATYLPAALTSLALDASGNVIISGAGQSGFPVPPGTPWPCSMPALGNDRGLSGFIGKIDSAGQHVLWGTWTGPSVPFGPVTVDNSGNAIAAGTDFNSDLILSAMSTVPGAPRLEETCMAQAAFPYYRGTIAPGEIYSIYNSGFGPAQGVSGPTGNVFGTELGGVQVSVEGVNAPLLYVSSAQINLVAPYFLNGRVAAHIKIVTAAATSDEVILGVQQAAPEIFEIPSNNPNVPPSAAILNQDGTVNSQANPAHIGDYVAMFVSGVGQTNPPAVDGAIATAAGGTPVLPVTVQLNTLSPYSAVNANVTYAGNAPGLVTGVTQVNFQMPSGIAKGSGPPYYARVGLYVGGTFSANYGPVIWFE
jgi:uncharacterized protein (TIGR03437 family)